MTEDQAKKHLKLMLRSFTAGSILQLLGEVIASSSRQHRPNETATEQHKAVQSALFVVGLGIDAAWPR